MFQPMATRLACCKRRVAEVLITDIRLPGKIDGWQIAKRCREHHPELRYRWS
ncbi:DNA-binding NtrC family response regulator [Bradyrhizobium japonicum]